MNNILFENFPNQISPRSSNSPVSDCEKTKKYDRQLRLWGDKGQYRIENSCVCLINANALGTEILKNLVLPGLGSFTIIDSSKITTEDDNNFFVSKGSYGQSRAKVATNLLLEMNPEVRGDRIEDSIESILESNSSIFASFSAVIASNIYNERTLIKLSEILWNLNIPLIVCYSIGFIGYIQLQIKEHFIIESHPDYALEDLRLDNPFPELKKFLENNLDFESLTATDLSHVPYIVIIYRYLKEWQIKNNKSTTDLPSNAKEKRDLKNLIANQRDYLRDKLTDDDGKHSIELENFDEAIKAVNQVLVKSNDVPKNTKKVLQELDQALNDKDNTNKQFWLLVKGLKQFMADNDQCLPVKGRIPDMTSDSNRYIQLQNIYKTKAREDSEAIHTIIQNFFNEDSERFEEISDSLLRTFCANSHCLRLVRTSQLNKELLLKDCQSIKNKINISCMDGDCESNELIYYLMIRSVCRFYTDYNRLPGDEQMENDIILLKSCFKQLLKEIDCNRLSKDDYVHEFCRYGGCELHSVSAFLAGAIAQEVIKLITGQYVPFNNILIYNAISSTTSTFSFD